MALVIRGKSKCPLCGHAIASGEPITSFCAFLPPTHEFGHFSDAAFHSSCFRDHEAAGVVTALFDRFETFARSGSIAQWNTELRRRKRTIVSIGGTVVFADEARWADATLLRNSVLHGGVPPRGKNTAPAITLDRVRRTDTKDLVLSEA